MSTAVAKNFEAHNVAEVLREKIRIEIADLMPPEMWKELLEQEVKAFLEPQPHRHGHGRGPSGLGQIVQEELRTLARARIKETLDSDEWKGEHKAYGEYEISQKVKELLTENAGAILHQLLGSAIQQSVQGLHYSKGF